MQVPAQLVLVVAHLFWCQEVEAALAAAKPAAALEAQLSTNIKQLQALTALVRGALSGLERKVGSPVCAMKFISLYIIKSAQLRSRC